MISLRSATAADIPAIHTLAVYQDYRLRLPHSSVWHETPVAIAEELSI